MKFRFKYSTIVWVLLAVVLAISLAGLGWNIYNLVSYTYLGTVKTVLYSVVVLLNGALCGIVLGVITYGTYVINEKGVTCYFGFIRSKYKIEDITQLTLFKKSNKLVMYFVDNKYTVIVISPEKYDQFILELRKIKPSIRFDKEIEGEDTPN